MRYEVSFNHRFYVEVDHAVEGDTLDRVLDQAVADELMNMALPCYVWRA